MFLIVLKFYNHTWKKNQFFVPKHDAQISGSAVMKKNIKLIQRIFKKKPSQLNLKIRPSKPCTETSLI